MAKWAQLQLKFEELLGTPNVYFQPPPNMRLNYPCIIFTKEKRVSQHADNIAFIKYDAYQVKVVDYDPDSGIPDRIETLPLCSFDRKYSASNLYHTVFTIYY